MFSKVLVFSFLYVWMMKVAVSSVVVGGPSDVPVNSCNVIQAAMFATEVFNNAYSKETTAYKIVNIISAQTQVVAGMKYILNVQLGLTPCRKDSPSWIVKSCPLLANAKPLLCDFTVVDIPWESKTTYTVTCSTMM